ncbi:MAG: hypothetical protein ACD_3C00086G0036 [uncultured bacterium (gcode 4)]|uniref:Uncharacterized protein n=1 Tax=uncultured bacterium (gcode 4) TaxID=1234023 RepID=K2G1U1_9BACT|nr:MAG: hypothetical protein ACD_3C00086G0036 [uncultured bacterium (gcode 4)]
MEEINFKIYFSDFFEVSHEKIEKYWALDISLLCDNPAFVDPFLIFFSSKPEYKELHKNIIDYISYLKEKSDEWKFEERNAIFSEVKEVWLWFSKNSNLWIWLNKHFANELKNNLSSLLNSGGGITKSSHLEKLCLIWDRVWADKISDFTINLIKSFLIDYTQKFAEKNIDEKFFCDFNIPRSVFDYSFWEWKSKTAKLPFIINKKGKKEFVLLTPKDILVKENGWITKNDYLDQDTTIIDKISNTELKERINKYFIWLMPKKRDKKTGEITIDDNKANRQKALIWTTFQYPVLLDYYIKDKEENWDKSLINNVFDTTNIETYLYKSVKIAIDDLNKKQFYEKQITSFEEVVEKVKVFKHYLEDRDGYKIFWDWEELKVKENDAQIMLDLIFSPSSFSVDKEINNWRWPVDLKVSKWKDSTLIEVKLASNWQIKSNLQKQLDIYKKADWTDNWIYVILYFKDSELSKLNIILKEVWLSEYIDKKVFLIDCRKKLSASKVK